MIYDDYMKKTFSALMVFVMVLFMAPAIPADAAGIGVSTVVEKKPRDPGKSGAHNPHRKPVAKPHKKRPRVSTARVQRSPDGSVVDSKGRIKATRQVPVTCVIIEQPIEKTVVYKTKTRTKTEKVLYGTGVIALAAVGVGLLTLFLGFLLGWRNAKGDEKRFYKSLLRRE